MRGKKLKDYVGKNEKTKIVAKLQRKGQGAPAREPVFSEEEQKRMMSYAYKKREEIKVSVDNDYVEGGQRWADQGKTIPGVVYNSPPPPET